MLRSNFRVRRKLSSLNCMGNATVTQLPLQQQQRIAEMSKIVPLDFFHDMAKHPLDQNDKNVASLQCCTRRLCRDDSHGRRAAGSTITAVERL